MKKIIAQHLCVAGVVLLTSACASNARQASSHSPKVVPVADKTVVIRYSGAADAQRKQQESASAERSIPPIVVTERNSSKSSEFNASLSRDSIRHRNNQTVANDVLMNAMGLIGTPYRWGGTSPKTGFDCSGFIGYVFDGAAGVKMPRSTTEMMQVNAPVISKSSLRNGDIVFFATNGGRRVSHAGIYVGDGRFIHAPSSGGKVRIDRLDNPYWNKAYLQAKRYLGEQQVASLR